MAVGLRVGTGNGVGAGGVAVGWGIAVAVGSGTAVGVAGTKVGVSVGIWARKATGIVCPMGSGVERAQATLAARRIITLTKTAAFLILLSAAIVVLAPVIPHTYHLPIMFCFLTFKHGADPSISDDNPNFPT